MRIFLSIIIISILFVKCFLIEKKDEFQYALLSSFEEKKPETFKEYLLSPSDSLIKDGREYFGDDLNRWNELTSKLGNDSLNKTYNISRNNHFQIIYDYGIRIGIDWAECDFIEMTFELDEFWSFRDVRLYFVSNKAKFYFDVGNVQVINDKWKCFTFSFPVKVNSEFILNKHNETYIDNLIVSDIDYGVTGVYRDDSMFLFNFGFSFCNNSNTDINYINYMVEFGNIVNGDSIPFFKKNKELNSYIFKNERRRVYVDEFLDLMNNCPDQLYLPNKGRDFYWKIKINSSDYAIFID